MTSRLRAILWIDHAQARLISFDEQTTIVRVIRPDGGTPHLHHKANSIDSGHLPEDQRYLHEVAQAIASVESVVVAGPGNAKLELMKHLGHHDPQLLRRVSTVETVDHPTNGQLLDLAHRHFSKVDRGLAGTG